VRRQKAAGLPSLLAAIDSIHLSGGRLKVSDLAALHHMSERTMRRHFMTDVGLAPKQYARVVQFHRALRLRLDVGLDLMSASLEAGYSDQAHMTRAFAKFGGFGPASIPEVTRARLPM
jgi:AraC-like DNA-binding protein